MAQGTQDISIEETTFVNSVDFSVHPLKSLDDDFKRAYCNVLHYFISSHNPNEYSRERLKQYDKYLFPGMAASGDKKQIEKSIRSILNKSFSLFMPWRNKYLFWLICDIAQIVTDQMQVLSIAHDMRPYLTPRRQKHVKDFLKPLYVSETDNQKVTQDCPGYNICKQNFDFLLEEEKTFIVTANMSAGKSTFINALIGKPLARTAQEACTGNVCSFFSKPFEDGYIHFERKTNVPVNASGDKSAVAVEGTCLTYDAGVDECKDFPWSCETSFATGFRLFNDSLLGRVRLIDTPGVNSVMNQEHGDISKTILKQQGCDKIIYLINSEKIATEEDDRYIAWIAENFSNDDVIFVLNRIDKLFSSDNDVEKSINDLKSDLENYFQNPAVYPVSSIFVLLLKRSMSGEELNEDEEAMLGLLKKKFNRKKYDLSKYYGKEVDETSDENTQFSQKCGMYWLEQILFGGD